MSKPSSSGSHTLIDADCLAADGDMAAASYARILTSPHLRVEDRVALWVLGDQCQTRARHCA